MANQVKICNRALARIGWGRIISINDNTEQAKYCKEFYDDIVDEVISAGPWTTAIDFKDLALLDVTPAYKFSYAYALPNEPYCLRVFSINECKEGDNTWRIGTGRQLLTNMDSGAIMFVKRLTDPESFGPNLTQTVIAKLSAELCQPASANSNMTQAMWRFYYNVLNEQLSIDTSQGSTDIIYSDNLIDIRE